MTKTLRTLFGPGVRWKSRRRVQRTLKQAADCRSVQADTLKRVLTLNAESQFSKDHALQSVTTAQGLRQAIPISDYERVAPYIEKTKQGDTSALLGRSNPLLMFALTSGTTSASKFIPVTGVSLKDYRRGWQDWGILTFDQHPKLHKLKMFQLCSDHDRFRTPAGTSCGNISGLVQSMQNRVVQSLYSVPPSAPKIPETEARHYFALRHSVRCRDLGMITTANPSTLIQIFRMLSDQTESLIRDLYNGTEKFPTGDLIPIRSKANRDIRRAKELDKLAARTGTLNPRDVWPDLQLMTVWTGGSVAAYLPKLRDFIGDLPIRDHGLHASEGRMTLPLEDETSSGLLDIGTHYFEFIPEDEIDSPQPTVLEAHELKEGKAYFILLTTASGLYRYDIHDVVECTGFYRTTPLLKFLHKGAHISNLTGEKLTESQVVQAVTQAVIRLGTRLSDVTLAPQWGDPPRYMLMYEADASHSPQLASQLAHQVETELVQLNSEYHEKRTTGRLLPIESMILPNGTWRKFQQSRQRGLGGSAEQYKHPFLVPKTEFVDEFHSKYVHTLPTAESA